jgi:hypothetical protein
MSTDVTKDVLVLKEASLFKDGDAEPPNVGKSFTKATATVDFLTIVPFLKDDNDVTEYIVRYYPTSFLFGGAKEGATLGPNGKGVDKVRGQCKEYSLDLIHWYKAIRTIVQPAHNAIITAVAAMPNYLLSKKRSQA